MKSALEVSPLNLRQRKGLREQLLKALQNIPTDGSTSNWSDVYVPASHLQALHPDRMVVEGMRGSGKSFWTGVLVNPDLRRELGNQLLGIDLKAALATAENIVFLYKGRIALMGTPEEFRSSKDPVVRQFFAGKVEGPMEFL